ncbi:hypothetical protein HYALB_00001362 [Hymenoscyphus albidus]|uniref:Uncharacterized protein n=1 Tax=Hymenoscyphus albidus TaxID=595503 RepID=A0A9N9LHP0_9HELO|nr:hypothetical protein HYALB_00001362 [Hymenoscyphus albidus]
MAPLIQPHHIPGSLHNRQNSGAAPQVTIVVTRGPNIYTSTIQLGSNQNTPPPQAAPTTAPDSPHTTQAPPDPQPTYPQVMPVGEDTNREVVAGAVIGSILGFAVLLFLYWRWRIHFQNQYYGTDTDSYYDSRSRSSDSYYSSEMRQRGGGGSAWERQHNRVRKPARVRRSAKSHRRTRDGDMGLRFDVSDTSSERRAGHRVRMRRSIREGDRRWTCCNIFFGPPKRSRGPSIHAWGSNRYGDSNWGESRRSGRSERSDRDNMSTIDD